MRANVTFTNVQGFLNFGGKLFCRDRRGSGDAALLLCCCFSVSRASVCFLRLQTPLTEKGERLVGEQEGEEKKNKKTMLVSAGPY